MLFSIRQFTDLIQRMKNKISLTTTGSVEGWKIEQHLGIVSGSIVAGTNLFSDMFASWTDILGGRSKSYQRQLDSIKNEALESIVQKASNLGANWIVGLKMDYDEIAGKNKSMLMVSVLGTAVVASRVIDERHKDLGRCDLLSGGELSIRAKRLHLLESCRVGNFTMDDAPLKFLCENKLAEFAPYIASLPIGDNNSESYEQKLAWVQTYFASMSGSEVVPSLYSLAGSGKKFAIELIHEMDLFDFDEIEKILTSEIKTDARNALNLAVSDKSTYSKDDIAPLQRLIDIIINTFPEQACFVEKGLFGKSKEKWQCHCGDKIDEEQARCPTCARDRRGFKEGPYSASSVIELLRFKIEALNAIESEV